MICATSVTKNNTYELGLWKDPNYSGDGSDCLYVALTGGQYIALKVEQQDSGAQEVLNSLGFDPVLFSQVVGYCLIVFVGGLATGWIMSLIRKAK